MNGVESRRSSWAISAELTVSSRGTTRVEGRASLLPSPATPDAGGTAGAIAQLYLLVAKRRDRSGECAKIEIDATQKEARAFLGREAAALAREQSHSEDTGRGVFASLGKIVSDLVDDVTSVRIGDAFEHLYENGDAAINSPKFWAELEDGAILVGKIAAVAASAAGTVASFGAAGPVLVVVVIAVSLSAASFVQDETQFLQELGVDDTTARWASVACAAAGAIITAGAGTAVTAAGQASSFSKALKVGSLAADVVSGGAAVTAGGAHIERGWHKGMAQEAVADRREAINGNARQHRQLEALIRAFTESDESASRTLATLQGVVHAQGQCLVLSTSRA